MLFVTSCKSNTLSVETSYFTRKDLASSVVGTPDPTKQEAVFGQRLYISWNVAPPKFNEGPLELAIQVRLKKGALLEKTVSLTEPSGKFIFPITGNDYSKKGGLLSYQVKLFSSGKELASSKHKFWVDPIQFSED